MLIGNYTHILDTKNRISVPSKWREILSTKMVITSGLDGSLFLFSNIEWQKNAKMLSDFGYLDTEARKFSRYMLANAFEVELDSHGRILLPETLVKSINLKEKVVLSGAHNRVELWTTEMYENIMQNLNSSVNVLADNLSGKISKNVVE